MDNKKWNCFPTLSSVVVHVPLTFHFLLTFHPSTIVRFRLHHRRMSSSSSSSSWVTALLWWLINIHLKWWSALQIAYHATCNKHRNIRKFQCLQHPVRDVKGNSSAADCKNKLLLFRQKKVTFFFLIIDDNDNNFQVFFFFSPHSRPQINAFPLLHLRPRKKKEGNWNRHKKKERIQRGAAVTKQ